jgi:hypothetical protein
MPDSKVIVQSTPVVRREVLDVPAYNISQHRSYQRQPLSSSLGPNQAHEHNTAKPTKTPDSPSTPILRIKPLPKSLQPLIRPPHILLGLFLFQNLGYDGEPVFPELFYVGGFLCAGRSELEDRGGRGC